MPTLATGISPSKQPRARRALTAGFTLVELMIVVFIIGLMTAGIVITWGGDSRDSELEEEGERLEALFSYVREQAELQTRDYGFFMNRLNYSFVVFDVTSNQWRVVQEDDALRERTIPEGLIPELVVEGRKVVLDSKRPAVTDFKPQVMIFGNGDISSFEVNLQRDGTGDTARLFTDEEMLLKLTLPSRDDSLPLPGSR